MDRCHRDASMSSITAPDNRVQRLQTEMAKLPQAQLETRHYFADGMYCREIPRPKHTVIVGKIHKREHFYMVISGSVAVYQDSGEPKVLHAPAILISKPGTKRAVVALTDAVCCTVHRTENTDLDLIEAELIEPEEISLFDARNELKELS